MYRPLEVAGAAVVVVVTGGATDVWGNIVVVEPVVLSVEKQQENRVD